MKKPMDHHASASPSEAQQKRVLRQLARQYPGSCPGDEQAADRIARFAIANSDGTDPAILLLDSGLLPPNEEMIFRDMQLRSQEAYALIVERITTASAARRSLAGLPWGKNPRVRRHGR